MKKIVIIIPYFGQYPYYYRLVIKSMLANKTVDWLFFTDQEEPEEKNNIKVIRCNLNDFNKLAEKKLSLTLNIKDPYKICDYKPAFGKIFEDYIKDYDFWGHADMDVIWGDIRFFIDKYLNSYDIISAAKDRIAGCFSLYKNTEQIKNLYQNIPDFKEKIILSYRTALDDAPKYFTNTIKKSNINFLSLDFVMFYSERIPAFWSNGKIFAGKSNNEIMMLHLYRDLIKKYDIIVLGDKIICKNKISRILNKIENKRGSKNIFWKTLVIIKDILWNIYISLPIKENKKKFLQKKYKTFFKIVENSRGIIHLGANLASESELYGFLEKEVLWIEANPELMDYLNERIKKHRIQRAINALITDKDNQDTIFKISNNKGISSSIYDFGEYHQGDKNLWKGEFRMVKELKLKSKTLETVLKENNINIKNYDLLVMDIQGAELLALKGSGSILDKITHIWTEVSTVPIYKGGALFSEINDFLNKKGFFLKGKEPNNCTDVLFERSKEFNNDDILSRNIFRLVKENNIKNIIETGTYKGNSTKYFGEIADNVHTIESDPVLYKKTKEREDLNKRNNITFHLGKSQDVLNEIIPKLKDETLFFLDAHWGKPCPTPLELETIAKHKIKPFILIHDFMVPNHPELGYDRYDDFTYDFNSIKNHIDKIYGKDNYEYRYNSFSNGLKRGVILIYPKNKNYFEFTNLNQKIYNCFVLSKDEKDKHILCTHNAGFYSNMTETINAIIYLTQSGKRVSDISFALSHYLYKDNYNADIFKDFFTINHKKIKEVEKDFNQNKELLFPNNSIYKNLDFPSLSLLLSTYFNPTKVVTENIIKIEDKYKINYEKLIAVHYRGTDKKEECSLADPLDYINVVKKILDYQKDLIIMIQTDQQSVCDLFLKNFGNKCFFIDELPMSESSLPIHKTIEENRLNYAINIDSVCRIMSKAKYLILGTGNMACITTLYRGNPERLYQFDKNGFLNEPNR